MIAFACLAFSVTEGELIEKIGSLTERIKVLNERFDHVEAVYLASHPPQESEEEEVIVEEDPYFTLPTKRPVLSTYQVAQVYGNSAAIPGSYHTTIKRYNDLVEENAMLNYENALLREQNRMTYDSRQQKFNALLNRENALLRAQNQKLIASPIVKDRNAIIRDPGSGVDWFNGEDYDENALLVTRDTALVPYTSSISKKEPIKYMKYSNAGLQDKSVFVGSVQRPGRTGYLSNVYPIVTVPRPLTFGTAKR